MMKMILFICTCVIESYDDDDGKDSHTTSLLPLYYILFMSSFSIVVHSVRLFIMMT